MNKVNKSIGCPKYGDEERDLIICITRGRDCKIGDCKTCGWRAKHEYKTFDGKWWLFTNGQAVRPLTDDEARKVIWGEDQCKLPE